VAIRKDRSRLPPFLRKWSTMSSGEDFTVSAVAFEERDWTPQEWRARKHISKSTHLKLKKAGLAPEEEVVMLPGFKLVRNCGAAAVERSSFRDRPQAGASGISRPARRAKPESHQQKPRPPRTTAPTRVRHLHELALDRRDCRGPRRRSQRRRGARARS
jgi:hypothetical protein